MTSRTLAPPARAKPRPPAPPPPPAARPPARRSYPENSYRRVLGASLIGSVLIHLLVLLVSPSFLRVGLPPGETDTPYDPYAVRGMHAVEIASGSPVEEGATAEPRAVLPTPSMTTPARQPRPESPVRRTPAPTGEPTPGAEADAGRTGTPLQPGYSDPRLYVTPRELPPEPEPTFEERHQRYMERLQARLDVYNDSIGAEAERARRATDWTVKDKDGNRWGLSPGKIHLGGTTLPLPVQLGGSGERQREADEERRQREEIQRDEEAREQREVMEERARATRERKNAEREKAGDP